MGNIPFLSIYIFPKLQKPSKLPNPSCRKGSYLEKAVRMDSANELTVRRSKTEIFRSQWISNTRVSANLHAKTLPWTSERFGMWIVPRSQAMLLYLTSSESQNPSLLQLPCICETSSSVTCKRSYLLDLYLTELLQEGVGHSTADDDAICFVDQILDELNPKAWLIDVNVARKMPQLKHTLPMFSCDAFCLAQVLLTLISCRQIRSINK